MATSAFKPPDRFSPGLDVNIPQAWADWRQEFEYYLIAAEKTEAENKTKVGMLLCSMGSQYIKVYNKMIWEAQDDKHKLDKVLKNFNKHFEPKKLLKSYITRFQQRVQLPNETLTEYITAVRDLAAHCEFGDVEESQICVQLSNGVIDQKLKEKLWEDDLTLAQLTKKCNFFDQSAMAKKLTGANTNVNTVHATRGSSRSRGRGRGHGSHYGYTRRGQSQGRDNYQHDQPPARGRTRGGAYQAIPSRGRGQPRQQQRQQLRYDTSASCSKCGRMHAPRQCPAYGQTCRLCSKLHHYARMCRSGKQVHFSQRHRDNVYPCDDEYEYENDNVYSYDDENDYDNGYTVDDTHVNNKMSALNIYTNDVTKNVHENPEKNRGI